MTPPLLTFSSAVFLYWLGVVTGVWAVAFVLWAKRRRQDERWRKLYGRPVAQFRMADLESKLYPRTGRIQ